MPTQILRIAADFIFSRTRAPQAGWIFFGGEPLLAPIPWFRRAREEVLAAGGRHGVEVSFGMQTNATLISEEVADYLAEVHIRPSVSLDGPPHLHDLMREGARRTLAGIQRLKERDLTPTVLVVLGPHNVERIDEVIDFLLSNELWRTKFNIFQSAGRGRLFRAVEPRLLAEARLRLVERMLDDDGLYDVNTARMMHLLVHSGEARPDDFRGCGAPHCGGGIRHVAVDPKGRIFPCDRCQTESLAELGSILEPPPDYQIRRRVSAFHSSREMGRRCRECPARRICHACCTAYRHLRDDREALCRAHLLLLPMLEPLRGRIDQWIRIHPKTELNPRPFSKSRMEFSKKHGKEDGNSSKN
jgi:uncharacterized protein